MSLKIIGAGFARTGTVSTKAAFEKLGFGPCYHMREILTPRRGHSEGHLQLWSEHARARHVGQPHRLDWGQLFARYASCIDLPTCLYYEELLEEFPDAKVVLTVRDAEGWFRSWKRLNDAFRFIRPFARFSPRVRRAMDITDLLVTGTVMGGAIEKASNIEVYERHNQAVRDRVPSERLLVFDVRDGWAPLCEFLGVEIPDEPFPHLNESKGSLSSRLFRYWVDTTPARIKAAWVVGAAASIVLGWTLTGS